MDRAAPKPAVVLINLFPSCQPQSSLTREYAKIILAETDHCVVRLGDGAFDLLGHLVQSWNLARPNGFNCAFGLGGILRDHTGVRVCHLVGRHVGYSQASHVAKIGVG